MSDKFYSLNHKLLTIKYMSDKSPLLNKSFSFAIDIVQTYKVISSQKKEFVLSKQLFRSGTSIGAMVREAQNAESKADFIHKLAIAQKECDESLYWLDLLHSTDYLPLPTHAELSAKATELLKMIRSSIMTTKKNLNQ